MSGLEDRVHDALADDQERVASPDLFERVVASIADDRSRRQRVRSTLIVGGGRLAAAAALVLIFTPRDNGGMHMPWWILEAATTAALVAVALWLGPFIKRFGRAYAADVFHDNPLTGKSYIVLTDIVYYLIFAAYILFTVQLQPREPDWGFGGMVSAAQVKEELTKVGGILLIIGALHGLNIVIMPMLGRLFSLNRRLPDRMG